MIPRPAYPNRRDPPPRGVRRGLRGSVLRARGRALQPLPRASPRLPGRSRSRLPPGFSTPSSTSSQHRTFRWFWDTREPEERSRPRPLARAVVLERRRGRLRPLRLRRRRRARLGDARGGAGTASCSTLRFLWNAPPGPAVRGGDRLPRLLLPLPRHGDGQALSKDVELSSIDTTLCLAGALVCRALLRPRRPGRGGDPRPGDELYERVDWRWMQPRPPRVAMAWHPESGLRRRRLARLRRVDDPLRARARLADAPGDGRGVGGLLLDATGGRARGAELPQLRARSSATSSRTPGSTSAASGTPTCAGRGSTTSRTRAAPSSRSGPTRSGTRGASAGYRPTSGASRPATARPT